MEREKDMSKLKDIYTIHYHVHMGFDAEVEAESEEEALEIAEALFEAADTDAFYYIGSDNEGVIEIEHRN